MKVYGIAEIARALDTDPGLVGKWRERHKLPAPDAELATGPVWLAGTIEPLLAAGGPEPRVPGQRLRKFQVSARMTAGPYPALTNDRRSNFQAAIAATHRTGYLKPPTARWDMLDEAVVTVECEAHEPSVAAETVRSIIRRNAELVAHIGVREIEIISISPADLSTGHDGRRSPHARTTCGLRPSFRGNITDMAATMRSGTPCPQHGRASALSGMSGCSRRSPPVLVDTEGRFWIRTVGAPRDGGPCDGVLHQPAREGATFAATQSRSNSLPSMSCITMHDSLSSSADSSRTGFDTRMLAGMIATPGRFTDSDIAVPSGSSPARLRAFCAAWRAVLTASAGLGQAHG